ncbi:MAG: hypothetical protein K0R51_758 [Cytophagaceae bacterium]|jgi:hypothetical protein|nr:hypothetical protein [Cytophagaceae bacterium]
MKITLRFLLLLFCIHSTACNRTPETLFEVVIDEDALPSAQVIEGTDPSFLDCCIFLHFTVDSTELASYLKEAKTRDLLGMNSNLYPGTEWWNPEKFGEVECFERNIKDNQETETFYVNANMTEVYYRQYLP